MHDYRLLKSALQARSSHIVLYNMPSKIQTINCIMQEGCILESFTPNLPIVRCEYDALIMLATVFSMA